MALQPTSSTSLASEGLKCMLGYPHKFEAAAAYIKLLSQPSGLSQETQLLLYALEQQALQGPCSLGRPGGWGWGNPEEVAKWTSWRNLGDLNRMEAMRLHVRTVEEEKPDWYAHYTTLLASPPAPAPPPAPLEPAPSTAPSPLKPAPSTASPISSPSRAPTSDPDTEAEPLRPAADCAVPGLWTPVAQGRSKPLPRYEHAAVMVADRLYVVGGNYKGRYLSDVWALDTQSMTWEQIKARGCSTSGTEAGAGGAGAGAGELPPIAGHSANLWNQRLILLGGHTKFKAAPPSLPAYSMDLNGTVSSLNTHGAAPPPRGGHTASLVNGRLYVFGGEDPRRVSLGDLWCLDLSSCTWTRPRVGGAAPAPRSAHVAAVYLNRYVIVFGGGSISSCTSDLHVLDTAAVPMTWTQPQLSSDLKVTPRAGHSAALVGSTMYIIGGGNNVTGCTDMLALDLTFLLQGVVSWHAVTSIPSRDILASEGVSLALLPQAPAAAAAPAAASRRHPAPAPAPPPPHVLLSFGGYNGSWHNAVSVMQVQEQVLERAGEAADAQAQEAGQGQGQGKEKGRGSPEAEISELRALLLGAELDAEAALKEAASAKAGAAHELALLRKQINAVHAALGEALQGWEHERHRVLQLEAEVAGLHKQLELSSAEQEAEELKRALKKTEDSAKATTTSSYWGF